MTSVQFIVRLVLAQLLGAAIGVERQWRQRMAGLRTNALVSTGAAMFVMLGSMIPGESRPTRVVSYVVSGIGFLGGGVIIREGFTVRGLNTAATLWCAAAVGCPAGWGFLPEASIGALSDHCREHSATTLGNEDKSPAFAKHRGRDSLHLLRRMSQ
jgi:putative Mg2+ transporter-C (MgtC) family protein